MDWTKEADFIPIISLLSLLLLQAHNKDDRPDLATHPTLSFLTAPTVLSAAPCLLLCAWLSQLQCHCKGPCTNTPFPKDNPWRGGSHHPEFYGYQARTTMRRRGSSLISKSLTLQDGCGLRDKQVTQTTRIPLRGPAPGALLDHLQVLRACWEVGEKKNGEPMYSHLHI